MHMNTSSHKKLVYLRMQRLMRMRILSHNFIDTAGIHSGVCLAKFPLVHSPVILNWKDTPRVKAIILLLSWKAYRCLFLQLNRMVLLNRVADMEISAVVSNCRELKLIRDNQKGLKSTTEDNQKTLISLVGSLI